MQVRNTVKIDEVRQLLQARFSRHQPSIFSSVVNSVDGDRITFLFSGATPDKSQIEYLVDVRGQLRVQIEDGQAFLDNSNIQDLLASKTEKGVSLYFQLDETGGRRMQTKTSANVGKLLNIYIDNIQVSSVIIKEAFGDRFVLLLDEYPYNNVLVKTVLLHGPLPAEAKIVSKTEAAADPGS